MNNYQANVVTVHIVVLRQYVQNDNMYRHKR